MKNLCKMLGSAAGLALVLGTIDWSAFTTALSGVVPDAVALAGILVVGAFSIALVFRGAKAVISWGIKFVR